jgi:putative ABC transport system ATP-binding protein/lipoprotein-releasing system ATP-binding protein
MGIIASHVGKVIGNPPARILTDVSLSIQDGEFVALTGKSGSGKSTLLYILSSLDSATEGHIEMSGHNVTQMKAEELNRFRNEKMGFVFQFHYLLAELTAIENVLMPAKRTRLESRCRERAEKILDEFGLGKKLHRLPRQLSGGEQQRVAIARALVMEPQYLFADEPTGSLDSTSGEKVMNIMREANKKMGTTIIMVTHDPDFAQLANRQIHLSDGKIFKT